LTQEAQHLLAAYGFVGLRKLSPTYILKFRKLCIVDERDEVQGVQRAETGVYIFICRFTTPDFEHCTTQQFARAVTMQRFILG